MKDEMQKTENIEYCKNVEGINAPGSNETGEKHKRESCPDESGEKQRTEFCPDESEEKQVTDSHVSLDTLRKEMDEIDRELVRIFERRMETAADIAIYKKKNGLPVFDPIREEAKLLEVCNLSEDGMKSYTKNLYSFLFELSRSYQNSIIGGERTIMKCGLLGEQLNYSYSPMIHQQLNKISGREYSYSLFEKSEGELEEFILNGDWDGLNVTIPYKRSVIKYCDRLSETAARLGSVNTLIRDEDGRIFGENTDYYGFASMVRIAQTGLCEKKNLTNLCGEKKLTDLCREKSLTDLCENKARINLWGKKALVLGSGGASAMAVAVLKDMGCSNVTVISRTGPDNYENLYTYADSEILVNTTPVGTYPNVDGRAVDLTMFPRLVAVFDLIYNPSRTSLILQAEKLGIPCINGLHMLVAQAEVSGYLFSEGAPKPMAKAPGFCTDGKTMERIDSVERYIRSRMENIVLIGMPGCGKTTIAQILGKKTGKRVVETDEIIVQEAGKSITELFDKIGEEGFRRLESEILHRFGMESGLIISTGGGCVTVEENYASLHRNGRIFYIRRDIDKLPVEGRPLSIENNLKEMYEKRRDEYLYFADEVLDNSGTAEEAAETIMKMCGI